MFGVQVQFLVYHQDKEHDNDCLAPITKTEILWGIRPVLANFWEKNHYNN